jgi:hypothetical protein
MGSPANPTNGHSRSVSIDGRWLVVARVGWLLLVGVTVSLVVAGFLVGFDQPELLGQETVRQALSDADIAFAPSMVVGLVVPMTACLLTGLVLFWRRSDDWRALLFALTLVLVGAVATRSLLALAAAYPATRLPVRLVELAGMALTVTTLFVFPDGRFVPRWSLLLAVAAIPALAVQLDALEVMLWLPDPPVGVASWRWGVAVVTVSILVLSGVLAQLYRYRTVSGPVERQQTKWIVFALGGWLLIIFAGVVLPSLFVDVSSSWFAWLIMATSVLACLLAVSVANAILRYRLYDIDRIISRTLAFALVTVLLGLIYTGVVVVLGQLAGRDRSSLVVAAATLAVAALFQPARRRIQHAVDRRFDRRRYDAARTIEHFGARLRSQVDIDAISAELLAVVDQTVQPTRATLWLRPQAHGAPAPERPEDASLMGRTRP